MQKPRITDIRGVVHSCFHTFSSLIQTVLSVPESHRINRKSGSRTFTAGWELHPTPKNFFLKYYISFFSVFQVFYCIPFIVS